jgi:predicted nucleic acid-binding protein
LGFFPITKLIIEQAISIRQQKKMSLADSVIAVTCIINNLTLFTYNQQDFQHLDIQLIELPENKNDQ